MPLIGLELQQPGLEALAGVLQMLSFGLEPADLGGHRKRSLCATCTVSDAAKCASRARSTSCSSFSSRAVGFDLPGRLVERIGNPLALVTGLIALDQPEQVLAFGMSVMQRAVTFRHLGLRCEVERSDHRARRECRRAGRGCPGIHQPAFRLAASLAVLGHPAASSKEVANLLRLGFDDARDHPLFDDRVGSWSQPGAEEKVDHILAANMDVVDVIG